MSCALDIAFADPWCRQHGIRVVAPDRPGVRDSSPLPGYRLEHSAADSAALADRLGIGNFAVAGWSAGGAHAIACAATLGDRVTATATAGCPAPSDGPRLGLAFDRILYPAARRAPGLARFLIAFAAAAPARLRESQTRRALRSAADLRTLDELPAGSLAAWIDGATATGPRGVFDDYFATGSDWRGLARSTTAPVHVFHGAQDRLVPPPHGLRLADLLPAGRTPPGRGLGPLPAPPAPARGRPGARPRRRLGGRQLRARQLLDSRAEHLADPLDRPVDRFVVFSQYHGAPGMADPMIRDLHHLHRTAYDALLADRIRARHLDRVARVALPAAETERIHD